MRLAKYSLLETKWVASEDGVPPRHTYRLTPEGMELARAQQPSPRPALKTRAWLLVRRDRGVRARVGGCRSAARPNARAVDHRLAPT